MRLCTGKMNHNCIFFTFIFILQISFCLKKRSYKNYKVFNIEGEHSDIMKLTKYVSKIDRSSYCGIGFNKTRVVLHPDVVTRFKDFATIVRVKATLINDDVSKLIDQEAIRTLGGDEGFNYDSFFDVEDIYLYLFSLQEEHPEWCVPIVSGISYEKRKIMGLKILTDVPLAGSKPKPIMVMHGGATPAYWTSPSSVVYFVSKLLSDEPDMIVLRNSFEWHIFPVINPDGYEYSLKKDNTWMKTRAPTHNISCIGVRLERNWNYNFGKGILYNDTCHVLYPGPRAFSEVESRSMAEYMIQLENITGFFTVGHGGAILVPVSDDLVPIENFERLTTMADRGIRKAGDYPYVSGTSYSLLNNPYSGSSMDWIYVTQKPPITYKIKLDPTFDESNSLGVNIIHLGEDLKNIVAGICIEAYKFKIVDLAMPKNKKKQEYGDPYYY